MKVRLKEGIDSGNEYKQINDFNIPNNIQNILNERGFYVYKWLNYNDFANLKIIKYPSIILTLIFIIVGIKFFNIIIYLVIITFIFVIILLIANFRLIISYFSNKYLVLTDKYILLGGEKVKLSDKKAIISYINELSKKLGSSYKSGNFFYDNNLSKKRRKLNLSIFKYILFSVIFLILFILFCILYNYDYKEIFEIIYIIINNDKFAKLLLVGIAYTFLLIYILFPISDFKDYIFKGGNFGLTKFIYIDVPKGIFKFCYNVIISITNLTIIPISYISTSIGTNYICGYLRDLSKKFDEINIKSVKLENNYKNLVYLLTEAKNNNYKDGLLDEIKEGLSTIGTLSQNCIDDSKILRKKLQNSIYNDIYDFNIYDKWIKDKIYKPISDIEELLLQNKNLLENSKNDIESKLNSDLEEIYKETLRLQLKRIDISLKNIDENLTQLGNYKEKLF